MSYCFVVVQNYFGECETCFRLDGTEVVKVFYGTDRKAVESRAYAFRDDVLKYGLENASSPDREELTVPYGQGWCDFYIQECPSIEEFTGTLALYHVDMV